MASKDENDNDVEECIELPEWAVRAGARKTIYYNPDSVNAAIVTCGGLCPGLNDVVQGIVSKLEDYGVPKGQVIGIRYCHDRLPASVFTSGPLSDMDFEDSMIQITNRLS